VGYIILEHIYGKKLMADLNARYLLCLSKVEEAVGYGSAERLCNQLALYMLSAEVFNEALGKYNLRLNTEGMHEFILRHALIQFNRDGRKLSFDSNIITKLLTENRRKFIDGMPSDENPLDPALHYGFLNESHVFLRSTLLNNKDDPLLLQVSQYKDELIGAGILEVPNSKKDSRLTIKIGVKILTDEGIAYKQMHFYQLKRG
jgi:hypothetical protein